MLAQRTTDTKATVYVAEADYERLSNLAGSGNTLGASLLAAELDRAIVVGGEEFPRRFARLHSVVEFRDLLTGRQRRLQLVPPDEADIDRDRLSVLAPVGAALLGLTAGDTIGLTTDDGRCQVLEIIGVETFHAVG
jgi:regulator of nucleoside diphosphate kinase